MTKLDKTDVGMPSPTGMTRGQPGAQTRDPAKRGVKPTKEGSLLDHGTGPGTALFIPTRFPLEYRFGTQTVPPDPVFQVFLSLGIVSANRRRLSEIAFTKRPARRAGTERRSFTRGGNRGRGGASPPEFRLPAY